jgi:hypothetical protein
MNNKCLLQNWQSESLRQAIFQLADSRLGGLLLVIDENRRQAIFQLTTIEEAIVQLLTPDSREHVKFEL